MHGRNCAGRWPPSGASLQAHHLSPSCAALAAGWAIGDGGRHSRSGRLPVRDARQRLHRVGSEARPEPSAPACRRAVQPLGKWPGAAALRLPRCSCGGVASVRCRVVVATHQAAEKKSRIGRTRKGVVYELFFTHLPQDAFTASDVVALAPPIVVPLNRCLPMKIRSRARIAGVVMRPPGKKRGKSSVSGSGISAWSWVISLSRLPCAPPRLLPRCKSR